MIIILKKYTPALILPQAPLIYFRGNVSEKSVTSGYHIGELYFKPHANKIFYFTTYDHFGYFFKLILSQLKI